MAGFFMSANIFMTAMFFLHQYFPAPICSSANIIPAEIKSPG